MTTTPQTICVDLDGTIAHYTDWQGEDTFGSLVPGSREALESLKAKGWLVIVHTTRASKSKVEEYLKSHGVPFDYINENPFQPENARGGKIYANVYVDDRAIEFSGDWKKTLLQIESFVPWEQREPSNIQTAKTNEAVNFLSRDFSETYSQLRHYDTSLLDITKFALLQLFAVVAGSWTIFSFATATTAPASLKLSWPWIVIGLVLVSYLFGLMSILMIARLRLYFVVAARYLNEHRNFFLATFPLGFANSTGFYTRIDQPRAFDPFSTHMIAIYVIGTASSLLLCGGSAMVLNLVQAETVSTLLIVGGALCVSFVFLTIVPLLYLKSKDHKKANDAVLGTK